MQCLDAGRPRASPVVGNNPVVSHVSATWLKTNVIYYQYQLKCLRGSHAWGRWFHPRKFATGLNYDKEGGGGEDERIYEDIPLEEINSGEHEARSSVADYKMIDHH